MLDEELTAELFALDLDDYDGITGNMDAYGQLIKLVLNHSNGKSYVLTEDDVGFRDIEEYDTAKEARDEFKSLNEEYRDFLYN